MFKKGLFNNISSDKYDLYNIVKLSSKHFVYFSK